MYTFINCNSILLLLRGEIKTIVIAIHQKESILQYNTFGIINE